MKIRHLYLMEVCFVPILENKQTNQKTSSKMKLLNPFFSIREHWHRQVLSICPITNITPCNFLPISELVSSLQTLCWCPRAGRFPRLKHPLGIGANEILGVWAPNARLMIPSSSQPC